MISLTITRLTTNSREIHITRGDSTFYEVVVPEEYFQEMRKVFNSEANIAEVGFFSNGKCEETFLKE